MTIKFRAIFRSTSASRLIKDLDLSKNKLIKQTYQFNVRKYDYELHHG